MIVNRTPRLFFSRTLRQSKIMMISLLLVLAMFAPTVLPTAPQSDCSCLLKKHNNQLYKVACNVDSRNQQHQFQQPSLSCSHEMSGYLPPGYEYVTARWLYKLYRTSVTYGVAASMCEQDGGSLAIPTSRAEAQAIARIIQKYPVVKEAFIGVNDIQKEGSFVSIFGTPIGSLGYNYWVRGQPDNWSYEGVDGEDCVTINRDGLYNDYRCDWAQAFVCQRRLSPVPPNGYRYVPQLGFYKHYTTPETYASGRQRCLDDGGYLAVIETLPEAEELLKFFDINVNVHEAYVGLNDIEKEGVFVTETGKKLESLSFSNWGNTEPNNQANGGENCVIFRKDGSINDVHCARLFTFICEIPLPK